MMRLPIEITRRKFLGQSPIGIGSFALGSLIGEGATESNFQYVAPRAKRVIYLFMSGGPSASSMYGNMNISNHN